MSVFTHSGILSQKRTRARPYATRTGLPNVALSSSIRGINTHLRHKNMVDFHRIRVAIPLFTCKIVSTVGGDYDLIGNIQAACSIEYPANSGTRYSFQFSGIRNPTTTAAAAGGYLLSDWLELGFTIPALTNFGTFTTIQTEAGNVMYANVFTGGSSNGGNEGVETSTGIITDKTVTGTIADGFSFGLGPCLIQTEGSIPSADIFGDSVADGALDNSAGDANGNRGYLPKYCYANGVGHSKFTLPGEAMGSNHLSRWNRRLSLFAISGSDYVISRYGTQDVTYGDATTLSQLQALKSAELSVYRSIKPGVKIVLCDFMPHTISSNAFIDEAGQSPSPNWGPLTGGLRDEYNNWVETLPFGTSGILDSRSIVENGTTGTWVVNGTPNYATSDGTYPQPVLHAALGNGLPSGIIVQQSNYSRE